MSIVYKKPIKYHYSVFGMIENVLMCVVINVSLQKEHLIVFFYIVVKNLSNVNLFCFLDSSIVIACLCSCVCVCVYTEHVYLHMVQDMHWVNTCALTDELLFSMLC